MKGLTVEAKQKPNEDIFNDPIVSTALRSATNNIEGTRELILPIVEHGAHSIVNFDIETITASMCIEQSRVFIINTSPHTSATWSSSLTLRHCRETKGGRELGSRNRVEGTEPGCCRESGTMRKWRE